MSVLVAIVTFVISHIPMPVPVPVPMRVLHTILEKNEKKKAKLQEEQRHRMHEKKMCSFHWLKEKKNEINKRERFNFKAKSNGEQRYAELRFEFNVFQFRFWMYSSKFS